MDFFAQQHRARRNTTLMVFLFVLAVAAIVLAVDLVAAATWLALAGDTMLSRQASLLGQVPAPVYWGGTLVALGVIAGGTLYRIIDLSKGGVAVARMVGARWVKRNSQDQLERRLLNIVEEMAIASGIAVPAVFVMDEEKGINAFAAGSSRRPCPGSGNISRMPHRSSSRATQRVSEARCTRSARPRE